MRSLICDDHRSSRDRLKCSTITNVDITMYVFSSKFHYYSRYNYEVNNRRTLGNIEAYARGNLQRIETIDIARFASILVIPTSGDTVKWPPPNPLRAISSSAVFSVMLFYFFISLICFFPLLSGF